MSPPFLEDKSESVLVIEEMKVSYKSAIGRGKLDGPMNVKRQSHIARLHIMQFGTSGVYIGRNFGENPHYMMDVKRLMEEIIPICRRWGIPLKMYRKDRTISSSGILCVWQGGLSPSSHTICETRQIALSSQQTVENEMKNMGFDDLYIESTNSQEKTYFEKEHSLRGARQMHFGYTSNNSLTRVADDDGNIFVQPSLIGGCVPPVWEKRFVSMTKIGDAMFKDPESSEIRDKSNTAGLYSDSFRNQRFASKINKENKIEAITYSETCTSGNTLKIHVDSNNDETENGVKGNYNYVVCAWKLFTKPDNSVVRIAIIAYSRRSISDFLLRGDLCRQYTDNHMTPWLLELPEWRKTVNVTSDIFTIQYFQDCASSDADGNIFFPPSLNKQATFLSSFADSILQFKDMYEKIAMRLMTVEKQLEIILPIVFSPSADVFCAVLNILINRKSSFQGFKDKKANLTSIYIEETLQQHGSLGSGRYFRHQPTFNITPDETWIRSSLLCLRETVIMSLRDRHFSFKMMSSKICTMKHIGPLLAQHLIHVMSLVGLIDPLFGSGAKICEGTQTARRLLHNHSIPSSSQQSLLEFVSARYSWLPSVAENAVCKHQQQKDTRFKDVLYATQKSVMWVVPYSDAYRIAYISRISRTSEKVHGQRTIHHKIRGPFRGDKNPFESITTTTDTNNSGSEEHTQWWYPLKKQELHILETNRSRPKKRPSQAITDGVPGAELPTTKKRSSDHDNNTGHRTESHFMSCVPTPRPPDWLVIDRKELQRIVAQYEKDVRKQVLQSVEASFGEDKNQVSSNLRCVHAVGQHFTVPSRRNPSFLVDTNIREDKVVTSSTGMGILGETKIATHLLSMGVPITSWNLKQATHRAMVSVWNSRNNCKHKLGNSVMTLTTTLVRARDANGEHCGHTYFIAKAKISLDTKGEARACNEFAIPNDAYGVSKGLLHEGTVRGSFFQVQDDATKSDNSRIISDVFVFAYITVLQAKTSLLWYLFWNNCQPEIWLPEYFPSNLWTSVKQSDVDRVGSDGSIPRYLLVTLQNGPKVTNKGGIFCTLIKTVNQGIWIRLEKGFGSTKRTALSTGKPGAFFCVCPNDPFPLVDTIGGLHDLGKSPPSIEAHLFLNEDVLEHTTNENSSTILPSKRNSESHVSIGVPFSIPINGKLHLREVLLVDPIIFNDDNEFSCMASDLKRWRGAWGSVLDKWKSTLLLRKSVANLDKYWHPPGTGSGYRFIRSKRDLRKFLDLCCGKYTAKTNDNSIHVDFIRASMEFSKL